MNRIMISAALAAAVAGSAAMADTAAQATTDLNLRAGPGVMYPVAGVIKAGDSVIVDGCVAGANWCKVQVGGSAGWAYGDYLSMSGGAEAITFAPATRPAEVTVIEEEDNGGAAVGGAVTGGLMAGALAAGPVGVAAAAAAGAIAFDAAQEDKVTTYVNQHPVDPVLLEGEVVVGSGVPEAVTLYPVPESTYSYAQINGVPVIVKPADRTVVHIMR